MNTKTIENLYDSHTHFLATGQLNLGLSLHELSSPSQLADLVLKPEYFRGEWLVGFGWNENNWSVSELPHRGLLDMYFPDIPVFFSRVDGHTSWLNSQALKKLGMLDKNSLEYPDPQGGKIHRDTEGKPTGVLSESAHMMVFEHLPPYSNNQVRTFLKQAVKIFNSAGFTHVRDMSSTLQIWEELVGLIDQKELTLVYNGNFTCENFRDLDRCLKDLQHIRNHSHPYLRPLGVKFFYDGSLGSKTALLSKPYPSVKAEHSSANKSLNYGLVSWNLQHLEEAIKKTWDQKWEVSIHCIGDQAVHDIALIAQKVSAQGFTGWLNIEHAQVVKPETIKILKGLHVRCYMQPCHWLSDKLWLKEHLGDLYPYSFPWRALNNAKIPILFGSDSPIERPSVFDNLKALVDSSKFGIPPLGALDPLQLHVYPQETLVSAKTILDHERIHAVYFENQKLDLF